MKELFFNMLNASFYGSIVILAVLILRLVLKKAPRAAICLLWLLAGIRLVLPISIESRLSLQPDVAEFDQAQQTQISGVQAGTPDMLETPALPQAEQVPAMPNPSELPEDVQIFVSNDAVSDVTVMEKPERVVDYGAMAAWVWAAGTLGLLVYSSWSYWRLRRRVREAVRLTDGSWECSGLGTAFVLGLFRPRIYLPIGLSNRDRELILAHERSHIARKDHWIKPIGYFLLMLHWFNPLVWLAYICLCRDIEMACDERVIRNMDVADRKDYSLALLNCGSRGAGIAACPVAFGEVGVKQRILGVLNYRKPGFWIITAAAAALVFVAVCLMTNPKVQSDSPNNDTQTQGEMQQGDTSSSQEEASPLELCRQALAEFQSRESGYVTWENSFSTSGTAQSRVSGEYWFVGENWLRRIDPNSASSVYRPSYLGIGNRVYRGSGDEVEEWFAVGDQGAAGLRLWIYGLTWDEEKISLLSDEWQDDERQITLEVQGTPPSVVDGSVTQYQVTFRFDREGNFLGTGHAYLEPGGEVDTMVVSTMDIREPAGKTPEQVLAEAREPLLRQGQQDLEQCRARVEGFQKQDSYHVVQLDFYGGNVLNTSAVKDYWQSGDDWLHTVTVEDVDKGRMVYRMKKDGVEYQQELYDTLTDNPQGWFWSVAEEPSDCMNGNWLAVFSWEDSVIEYVGTDDKGSQGKCVTLKVLRDPSVFGQYCPYTVRFNFDSDESFITAALILVENQGEQDWRSIVSHYAINYGDDADAQIDAAYKECQAVLNGGGSALGMTCMVEGCSDPAHDHSARDCTDSNCTIPDHHHDHDHH